MVTVSPFGQVGGAIARAFDIVGEDGFGMRLTDYGARLVSLTMPDRSGRVDDIVLGFDDAESYAASTAYLGATVGRYANRIRGGRLRLHGHDYQLDRNDGANHLHGGRRGWDSRIWDADYSPDAIAITFRMTSPAGDMGFPGACEATTTYELLGNRLRITMTARPDATTVVNMAHHSYFNLAGHGSGPVLDHLMRIPADFYSPVDDELLPTGEIRTVIGTRFDFRSPRPIGAGEAVHAGDPEGVSAGEYDNNWCLRGGEEGLIEAAEVIEPASGRRLRLWSTEPGLQVYTGGYFDDSTLGKEGQPLCRFAGLALETQKFPDSPRFAHFPSTVVRADDTYRHVMEFEFSTV